MRKVKIILGVIIILGVLLSVYYFVLSHRYNKKINELAEPVLVGHYSFWFMKHYQYEGEYPRKVPEWSYPASFDFDMEYDDFETFSVDPFSEPPSYIVYFPIHDRETDKVVSYILLSRGIDGKLNNYPEEIGKLYYDNWWA